MSRPIVVVACMTWLLRIVGALTAPTSMALNVPVEEPSTASQTHECARAVCPGAFSPSRCELHTEVIAVMSARPHDHIADIETNRLDGEGRMRCYRPGEVDLAICAGVTSGLSGRAGHGDTALSVHRIGCRFPALRCDRDG